MVTKSDRVSWVVSRFFRPLTNRSRCSSMDCFWPRVGCDWRGGGEMTLVSQTGYVRYRLDFDDELDFSKQPWTDFIRNERYTPESEEIRLLSESGGRGEYLV